jgi:outer membrane murein-binding lipoprotein Lpp
MSAIWKFIDHNRGLVAAIATAVLAVVLVGGCQAEIKSPLTGQKVTRQGLDAEVTARLSQLRQEVASVKAQVEPAYQELALKQSMIDTAFQQLSGLVGSVPGPWQGVAATGLGLLAMGVGYDNRRKDGLLRKAKNEKAPGTTRAL